MTTKKTIAFIRETLKIVILAAAIVVPVRYFLFQPFFVRGQSMDPNFENGDYLIVDEISYRFRQPQRGEVIVFNSPQEPSQRFIKRIIGLPGEVVEIKEGKVAVYSSEGRKILDESGYILNLPTGGNLTIALGGEEYFVLGDNRPFSYDSRRFGSLPEDNIIGRVVFRAWPFGEVRIFEAPNY